MPKAGRMGNVVGGFICVVLESLKTHCDAIEAQMQEIAKFAKRYLLQNPENE